MLVTRIKRVVFLTDGDYKISELVLIHMLRTTLALSGISVLFNPLLDLSSTIIYTNYGVFLFLSALYWLVRVKKRYRLGRSIYLTFVVIMINFLWFETEGSAGPSLFYILAFLPIYIFMVESKKLKWGFILVAINIPLLLAIEINNPELVKPYDTNLQRILDMLMVSVVFIIFEVPLLMFAKKAVISERNAAQHSERVKTSYITNMSHEIRTPMNAILGFTELLKQDDVEVKERHKYIDIINDNGHTLLNLLNNIINLSKIEDNQGKVTLSEVSANDLLQRVHGSLSFKNISTQLDFSVASESQDDVKLVTDVVFLYQIITNLAFNALKFTEEGHVHLGFTVKGEHITFWVKDTGTGIDKDKQRSIFKQFEQADDENRGLNLSGTGLGLTICKGLSKRLQGKLCLESTPKKGSTFYLKLPLKYMD